LDVLAAATVLAASAMLVFPALQHSRFDARLAACQENLHRLHLAAAGQSGRYYGGFPAVLRRGRLAPTGAYAAMPVSEGNLSESVSVVGLDWSLSGDGSSRGCTLGVMPAAPASDPSASRLPGYHGLSLEGRGQVLWGDGRVTFFPSASLLDESEGMFVNAHVPAARRGGAPVRSSAAVPVVFVANPR